MGENTIDEIDILLKEEIRKKGMIDYFKELASKFLEMPRLIESQR